MTAQGVNAAHAGVNPMLPKLSPRDCGSDQSRWAYTQIAAAQAQDLALGVVRCCRTIPAHERSAHQSSNMEN